MSRPSHSAARDAAWGRFYAKGGARNAIVQGIQGGQPHDNVTRIAEYHAKVCKVPREQRDAVVPVGANVIAATFQFAVRRPLLRMAR